MKITMYELLGMVKDGKAPKKIKYKDKIYYYHEGYDFKYMYNSSNYSPMDRDKSLFTFDSYKMKDGRQCWDNKTAIDFLNDEVEILEEKEICHNCHKYPAEYNQTWCEFCLGISKLEEEKKKPEKIKDKYCSQISKVELAQKYNEIIDYLEAKENKHE